MSTEPIDPKSSARAFYAAQLKRLRTEAKLTQPELGGHPAVMVSGKLIGHVENCYRPPTRRLSQGLDRAFALTDFFEGMYAAIKRESGPTHDFWEYAEYEGLACSIKFYQSFLVNGLLQTEEYARELLSVGQRPDQVDRLVSTRMDRQEILHREEPPWLVVLLDESVIHRVVGNCGVQQRQLERLSEAAQEPTITVRIVPDGARIYPSGAFTLLAFDDAPSVCYAEGVGKRGQLIEDSRQVREIEVLFDQISGVALPVQDSEKLIQKALEDL